MEDDLRLIRVEHALVLATMYCLDCERNRHVQTNGKCATCQSNSLVHVPKPVWKWQEKQA